MIFRIETGEYRELNYRVFVIDKFVQSIDEWREDFMDGERQF